MYHEIASDLKTVYNLEILFAGECNLHCAYCVIHKNKEKMLSYNKEIINSILSGIFQKNIIEKFSSSKDILNTISLWGAEPSLNSVYAEKLLFPLLDFFSNVSNLMFSTNAIIGFQKGILPFFESLNRYSQENKRHLTLNIQFSIDGPVYITDLNRGQNGATNKVITAIQELIEYADKNINDFFTLQVTTKPTVSPENQLYLLKNNKVFEWFKFFDDLTDSFMLLTNKTNIMILTAQEPTICSPYNYTQADGIIYKDFIKSIKKIDDTKLKYYKHPLIRRYCPSWNGELGSLDFDGTALLCNAGLTATSIDYEGNIMTCHRIYDGWRSGGADYPEPSKSVQYADNKKDEERISYISKTFFLNHRFRMTILESLLTAMVSAGEIDRKYLNVPYQRILQVLMASATCYAGECGFQTAGLYLVPFSRIRLLCNGALEEIVDYYEKYL